MHEISYSIDPSTMTGALVALICPPHFGSCGLDLSWALGCLMTAAVFVTFTLRQQPT